MQKLNAFAAETPFQTHDIDVAAEKMLAFGFKAKDVIPDITAIGDALSALGEATPAQLSGVVDVFGKIQAAGKLSAANMHELAVRGIPAWQMLSEEMGKPVDVLQKMVSKGAIPASTAIDDLRKGMEKTFGGGMATQAQTFNGLMSTLKSNADQALAAFVGPVMKEAEGGISGIANTLASPAFQTFATGVGAMIAHTFSDIGRFAQTNVVPAVDDVVKAFASPSFKSFADTVGKGISLILHDIGDIGKNIVEPAIKGVAGVFASPQFADFTGKMGDLGNSINNVVMPAVISLKPDITDLFNVFKTVALPALSGVADGLSKTIGWFQKGGAPADALKIAIAGVAAGLTAMKIGQFVAALPGLIAQLGIWAGAQWAVAIPALMTALPYIAIGILVTAVVAGIILAVQHWGQIAHWLQGVWAGIAGFFEWLWGKISGFFVGIGKWFADKFTEAYNGVIGAFGNAGKWFSDTWNTIITDATNAGKNIVKGIADGITNAIHFVTDAIHNVTSWISDHLPHSPAKEGPLTDLLLQGSLITQQLAEGMLSGMPHLEAAIGQVTKPISTSLSVNALPSNLIAPPSGLSSGNDQQTQYLAQLVQGVNRLNDTLQQGRGGNLTMNNSFGAGAANQQQIAQALQVIFGFSYESTQRGTSGF